MFFDQIFNPASGVKQVRGLLMVMMRIFLLRLIEHCHGVAAMNCIAALLVCRYI